MLVTDGEQRAALAIVRSLGRAGHRVYVCSARPRSLAGASRWCRQQAEIPDPLHRPADYVGSIRRLVERWGIDVLIPVTEASLLALLPERERLEGVLLPFADCEDFRAISDKQRVLEAAGACGIAVPRQTVLGGRAELESIRAACLRFPIVAKPARSVVEHPGGRAKLSVHHARDWPELAAVVDVLSPAAFPLLLQERIDGPGIGVFALVWDGVPRAFFGHRRIREKPPSGGVSVYRESVALDPELLARAVALLRHFRWEGVAMVEFKVDRATGVPYLMEINGRFWGSLQLAVDAGIDFPELLLRVALGESVAAVEYEIGIRSRWWWGDVDHLLLRLRRSDAELALPPGSPTRWGAALDFLALHRRGDRSEILRMDDPRPFIRETLDWLARR